MELNARELKTEIWKDLQERDLDMYELEAIDVRLRTYVEGVQQDFDLHNLDEMLAVEKFLRMLRQSERMDGRGAKYRFSIKVTKRFYALYESLKFSGMKGRRQYKLTPVQCFQFANELGFFEWVEKRPMAEGEIETEDKIAAGIKLKKGEGKRWRLRAGKKEVLIRLTKRAILFVPRKYSKTTQTASLVANELLTGDSNAQAYAAANSYKQAQILFKETMKIIKQLDPGRKYFRTTREMITWRDNVFGKESSAECLSGGSDTKDGLNASFVCFDEYAAASYKNGHSDGAELLQVLESSMGTRKEPLTQLITTASRVPDGPFAQELANAKKVLMHEAWLVLTERGVWGKDHIDEGWADDSLFASLFHPDDYDLEKPESFADPNVWKKCNPHIGVTVQQDYYRRMYEKGQHNVEAKIEFETKLLNVFSAASVKTWIGRNLVQRLQREFDIAESEGRPIAMVGVDLSVSDDFSAVVYNVRGNNGIYYNWLDCYIPEEALETHENKKLYKIWVDNGWMHTCPGAVINYNQIVADILKRNEHVKILQIGYDPAKSKMFVNAMSAAIQGWGGDPEKILIPVNQSYYNFTAPVETLEFAAKNQPPQVAFDRNPIWPYCFANAYCDTTKSGLKKPIKTMDNLKIDPVIACLETFKLYGDYHRPVVN